MFGIGFWEVVLILVVALIVLGPDRFPELARSAGKLIRELKSLGKELRDEKDHDASGHE
ncbi:MAG: twin-arginine translocase subunit TatB [Candidatus Omnitrophica bacterium]|nr:twin-arginine translocase subunit TatB [Candidatus Omnitrophota bacterium]